MTSETCENCGFKEDDHERIYCRYCGAKLKTDRAAKQRYCGTNPCTWCHGAPCKKFQPKTHDSYIDSKGNFNLVRKAQNQEGCGRTSSYWRPSERRKWICGELNPKTDKLVLCPSCQEKEK